VDGCRRPVDLISPGRSYRAHFCIPDQIAPLLRAEYVDRVCRAAGISAGTAREALGFLQFPLSYTGDNVWDFVRGSTSPREMSVEEARALLQTVQ
jgi:hypothetical protein